MTTATATPDRHAPPASPLTAAIFERRWRNALARRVGIGATSLQAVFGAPLGTGRERTWRFFDTIATTAPIRTWREDRPGFAGAYGDVLGNIVPRHNDALRELLGARYASWQAFRSDPAHLPFHLPRLADGTIDVADVLVSMFQSWAIGQLAGGELRAAIAELRRPDVVTGASALHAAARGRFAWSTTDEATTPTTARSLVVRFTVGGIAVHVRCSAAWRIDGRPAAPATPAETICGAREGVVPWFDPAALSLARDHDGPTVWRRRLPTWAATFGPGGSLQRVVTGLVVADAIDVVVRPRAGCHRSLVRSTIANVADRAGPSFAADGCGEGRHERAEWRWASPSGEPQVIGLVTAPIDAVL